MSDTQSKIDSLQELNSQLIATIAELRKENAKIPELEKKFTEIKSENMKLKQIIEENVKRDVRVEELEQKNKELEARLAVVEQSSVVVDGQPQNDSRSEVANASKEAIPEVVSAVIVPDSQVVQLEHYKPDCKINDAVPSADSKTLEDKEIDEFLDSKHKKKVSKEIIQNIKEKKLRDQELLSTPENNITNISREQGLIQEISSSIKDPNCDNSEISANNVRPNCDNSEITRDFETQDIICLYQNACVAEKDAIEANQ